jgi:seryl-tRNA(Sec) selenium transferase
MTLTLDLRPELQEQLKREAAQRGLSPEKLAVALLEEAVPGYRASRNAAAIEMLRSWAEEGDEEEQRETGEFLMRALDEDRTSDRKLFP